MKFELPDLPYKLVELEPHISKKTLEFHYGNHLHTYAANLNSLIPGTRFENLDLHTIIKIADGDIFNNAAQIFNHIFYFDGLRPCKENKLNGQFSDVIEDSFGSISFFKNRFTKAAKSLFGAGWIWLVLNQNGLLEIIQEKNAGNPLRKGLVPLLACDVWEHAYYLDYQDRRMEYIKAFWNLVNWELVEKRYNDAI